MVLANETIHVHDHVTDVFPNNEALQMLGPRSYFGCPLAGSKGRVIGHLAAMDDLPVDPSREQLVVARLVAPRAAAELERRLADRSRIAEMNQANDRLRAETERRERIEAALKKAELRLQRLSDPVAAGIAYVHSDGCYQFADKAFQRKFDLAEEDILGQLVRDVAGKDRCGEIRNHVKAVLSGSDVPFSTTGPD